MKLSDGTAQRTNDALTGAKSVTAATITDGVATLNAGSWNGLKSMGVSSIVAASLSAATITNGSATITGGAITAKSLVLSGAFTIADVEAQYVNVPTSTGGIYFGGVGATGSWRLQFDGTSLNVQSYVGSGYVTKHAFK